MDDLYDQMSALSASLGEIYYDSGESDKSGAIAVSIDQFKQSILEWADECCGSDTDETDETEPSVSNSPNQVHPGFMASADVALRMMKYTASSLHEEVKVGRTISKTTRTKIESSMEAMKNALTELETLLTSTNGPENTPQATDGTKSESEPSEEKLEGPEFLKILAGLMSTQSTSTTELKEQKPGSPTSDINEDVRLMELVKRISSEAKSIVA